MLEKIKSLFPKKKDYKALYEAQIKTAEDWEWKYNKLRRQIEAVLKNH